MNPILIREGIERFRGKRVWPFLFMWIIFNGGIVYLLYLLAASVNDQGFGPMFGRGTVGPFVFHGALSLMLLGIIMFLPGMAAVGIVGERERQTMRLLQTTNLSPLDIVLGKVGAALGYTTWLLVALLPVVTAPLGLGGVGLGDVFGALMMLTLIAVAIASISIWISARSKSTRSAVAGSYLLTFGLLFLTPLFGVAEGFVQTEQFRQPLRGEVWTVIPNPYLALVSAVTYPLEVNSGRWDTVFYPGYQLMLNRDGIEEFGAVNPNRIREVNGRQFVTLSRPPFWVLSAAFYLIASALALRGATRWVTAPSPSEFSVKRTR